MAWLLFYASWLAIRPGGDDVVRVFTDTAYLLPLASATLLAVMAWRRVPAELRRFWGFLAAASATWLAADTLWCVRDLATGSVPYPYWSDLGYLVSNAFMIAAILSAYRPRFRAVPVARLLDGSIAVGTVGLLWWWLLIHPTRAGADLEGVTTLAYPVFGLAVFGTLLATRVLPARHGTFAMRLVSVGIAASMLANALYVHSSLHGGYVSGEWTELGWQLQGVLFSLAAWAAILGVGRMPNWMRFRDNTNLGTPLILTGALTVSLAVLAVDGRSGGVAPTAEVSVFVLAGLVVARLWVVFSAWPGDQRLVDPATGLYSGDYLRDTLSRLAARARHFREPFAMALVALDRAGSHGSTEAAAAGRRLAVAAREVDVVAFAGSGRFAVILPNVEADEAAALAEGLRRAFSDEPLADEASQPQTVSVGVALWTDGDDPDALVARAEDALAAAERLGGNQIRTGADHVPLFADHPLDGERVGLLAALARLVDDREGPDRGHSVAVGALAARLAIEMGLDAESVSRTYAAGLLHDLGKLALPEAVLQKPGPLDEREWAEMTRHSALGAELVSRIAAVREAAPIVAAHHERWDGAGYPAGLTAERIPAAARIVAVADAFAAMTSDRPYRPARSETSALTTIWRDSGKRYDPAVVSALLALARAGCLAVDPPEELAGPLAAAPAPAPV